MRESREISMPYSSHAPGRLPAVVGLAFFVVALALACSAHPARADEAPKKPATDATVRIKAFPPSIQVDAKTAVEPDDSGKATSEAKPGDKHIRVEASDDFDVDAFTSQVHKTPWVIGLIFLVVGSIFLTPVILLVGIIWYKLRKARLQNEAMLALAARGVIPPARAAEALAVSAPPESVAPQVYQQALSLRKRLIWSDLRKGVILSMAGLAFLLYGITGDGEPSWVGLILLFVGIGYVVLWRLEGRHLQQTAATSPGDSGGTTASGG
jgi:hypothetical protein